jgi:holo-[acyl-carrier protein] synthase
MMLGVGVDVCEIARLERALGGRAGSRFRLRTFTPAEVAYCDGRRRTSAQSYAATFAAKEAVLKALGTGWAEGLGWHDVEIVRDGHGAPGVVLHGAALARARRGGTRRVHLTLSHGGGLAVAVAVLEGVITTRRRRAGGGEAGARPRRPRARRRTR